MKYRKTGRERERRRRRRKKYKMAEWSKKDEWKRRGNWRDIMKSMTRSIRDVVNETAGTASAENCNYRSTQYV